nr:MAG TPA: hypothetical protein [Caudoviricetes sp.]
MCKLCSFHLQFQANCQKCKYLYLFWRNSAIICISS